MRQLLLFSLLLFFVSCGTQKQLQKLFVGKPVSILNKEFGNPKTVIDRGGEKVYIFEKIKNLKSTEISQGKRTLDPMISPMTQKTERFYFTVKEGKIVKAKLEEEYER
ncbi:MAG: hypothetical protein L3J11_07540 [Draconibacterium sp.]|nr:hypothetical protein [Draconibacterium sp.]